MGVLEVLVSIMVSVVFTFAGLYFGELSKNKYERHEAEHKIEAYEQQNHELITYRAEDQKLLQKAVDRADRLAAINQGLTEELAALKSYDPEEVEERIKKIREIRAEEERQATQKKLSELNDAWLKYCIAMMPTPDLTYSEYGIMPYMNCVPMDLRTIYNKTVSNEKSNSKWVF